MIRQLLLFPLRFVARVIRFIVRLLLEIHAVQLDLRASASVGRAYWHGRRQDACNARADRLGRESDRTAALLEEWI